MTNFYQVNTTAFILKLKLKNKSTKIIWYITNIQKDQTQFCPNTHTKIFTK